MAGPWEQYAAAGGASSGPWDKYVAPQPQTPMQGLEAIEPSVRGKPDKPTSLLDKVKGTGEAALAIGTGTASALAAPFVGAATPGDTEKNAASFAQRNTYQPKTQSGQSQLGAVSEAVDASKLAGIGPMAAELPGIPKPPVGQMARSAAGKVGEALTPNVAPQVAQLAQKAESYGIPLRPDMLSNNKIMRMVGEALEKVPLSGAKNEQRQTAFNKAIMGTIGAEGAEKLTPDVFAKALDQSGGMIGNLSEKYPVPLSGGLATKLNEHVAQAKKFETADVANIVESYVKEIQDKVKNGAVDGTAFRKLRTKLTGQMRRTNNGDLKHALDELDDTMLDAIQGQLTPEELQGFNTARRQYANAKTLEPMVAKSPTGDMSPAALMGRMTATGSGKSMMAKGKAGELGDIARIGQQFLKEPASSGTTERSIAYGLLGGGAAINPYVAAMLYGGANAYNRAGPALARGMIPKPP